MSVNEGSDGVIPCQCCHLVGSLVVVVAQSDICTSEQQQAGAGLLVVEGTDMQGCVAAGVSDVHVSSVKHQVLQMLDTSILASL